MGRIDNLTKEIFSRPNYFADAVNLKPGASIPLVRAENLRPLNTNDVIIPYGGNEVPDFKAVKAIQRYRDALSSAIVMNDGKATYAIFGVEAQTTQQRDMVVRILLYDAMTLTLRIESLKRKHEEKGDCLIGDDYISGFTAADLVPPVITVVLNLSGKRWQAPKSLKELYGEIDPRLALFVQDYKLFVMEPLDMRDDLLYETNSDMGIILGSYKYMDNAKGMMQFMQRVERFQNVDVDAARVVNLAMHGKLIFRGKAGSKVNMCKAFEKWEKDSVNKGIKQGMEKGMKKGLKQGLMQGIEKGIQKGLMQGIEKGIQKGLVLGIENLSSLLCLLIQEGRHEEVDRCLKDKGYCMEMMASYGLA